jgi:hypothetical protein
MAGCSRGPAPGEPACPAAPARGRRAADCAWGFPQTELAEDEEIGEAYSSEQARAPPVLCARVGLCARSSQNRAADAAEASPGACPAHDRRHGHWRQASAFCDYVPYRLQGQRAFKDHPDPVRSPARALDQF